MTNTDHGVKYYSEFHKVQFYRLYCSTSSYMEDVDIANYVDDSTPCNTDKNNEFVVNGLEQSLSILFNDNYMKVNADKNHLLVSKNVRATAKEK